MQIFSEGFLSDTIRVGGNKVKWNKDCQFRVNPIVVEWEVDLMHCHAGISIFHFLDGFKLEADHFQAVLDNLIHLTCGFCPFIQNIQTISQYPQILHHSSANITSIVYDVVSAKVLDGIRVT